MERRILCDGPQDLNSEYSAVRRSYHSCYIHVVTVLDM